MRKITFFTFSLLFIAILFSLNAIAQDFTQQDLANFRIGKGIVSDIAYSSDGTRLAVASSTGIWLYDTTAYQEIALLTGHTERVTNLAFSPDGGMLASGSRDRTIRLWNAQTGAHLRTLEDPVFDEDYLDHREINRPVTSIAFSPDGTTLASGVETDWEHTVLLWNVMTGAVRQTLLTDVGFATSVTFSPDGRTLASGSDLGYIILWDAETGESVQSLYRDVYVGDFAEIPSIHSIAFSPDGLMLASSEGWSGTVVLWDTEKRAVARTLGGNSHTVRDVAFSPDGARLAAVGDSGRIALWEITLWMVGIVEEGEEEVIDTFWEVEEALGLEGHTGGARSIAFSPDGLTIASGSNVDGSVRLWDSVTGALLRSLDHTLGDLPSPLTPSAPPYTPPIFTDAVSIAASAKVHSVAFSPDGGTLATGNADNTVSLRSSATGQLRRTLSGHKGKVRSVTFSPDGGTLASGSADRTIRLWDAYTGELKRTLTRVYGTVWSVAFSPDGSLLASGTEDRRVHVWDLANGRLRHTLSGHKTRVWNVAFSPDGTTLASSGEDPDIRLWDVQSGELTRTLSGHEDKVLSVAFSPDGATLASASADMTLRSWDVATGALKNTFSGHTDWVFSVAVNSDGRLMVSGSKDQTVRLWDIATGASLDTFAAHTDWVRSVAINPDGMALASGGYDNVINLWTPATPPDASVDDDISTDDATTDDATIVSISPATIQSPQVGGQFDISIDIARGANVGAYEFTLTYDSSALSLVALANADYLPAGTFVAPPSPAVAEARGQVKIAATALGAVADGDGTLATATFEVVEVKDSNIGLTSLLSDAATLLITHTTTGSAVSVDASADDDTTDDGTTDDGTTDDDVTTPEFDVNGDGVVTIADLVLIAQNYGQTGANAADVNGDGVVDAQDFVLAAGALDASVAAAPPAAHHQVSSMLSANDVRRALSEARALNLADPVAQRGILYLERLLAALIPKETILLANYPNPFNPETWIPYRLAADAHVSLRIYDPNGRVVRTMDLGHQRAAAYESRADAIYWDGRNNLGERVTSGLYFYTLTAGDYTATRKMLIGK